MVKVIDNFETVLLIAKSIGYQKTISLLQNIVAKQKNNIDSEDVKNIYDEEYFQKISTQKEKRLINTISVNSYIDISVRYFEDLGKKDLKILDYGCGSGNFVLALASLGFMVDGFDYFEPTIREANKKSKKLSIEKNCNFYCDLNKLKGKKYDYIVFSDVVEHISLKELNVILNNLQSNISNHGKLIFHTPNGFVHESCPSRLRIFDLYFLFKNWMIFHTKPEKTKIARLKAAYYDQVHINIITPIELKNILTRHGFSDFRIDIFDPYAKSFVEKLKSVGSFWLMCEKK